MFKNIKVIRTCGYDSKSEYRRSIMLKKMQADGKISSLKEQQRFEFTFSQGKTTISLKDKADSTGIVLKKMVSLVKNETKKQGYDFKKSDKDYVFSYVADFTYIEDDVYIVEDVKGVCTDTYLLKKKMMGALLGVEIRETLPPYPNKRKPLRKKRLL